MLVFLAGHGFRAISLSMPIVSRPWRVAERTRTQSGTRSHEGKALTTRFGTRSRAHC